VSNLWAEYPQNKRTHIRPLINENKPPKVPTEKRAAIPTQRKGTGREARCWDGPAEQPGWEAAERILPERGPWARSTRHAAGPSHSHGSGQATGEPGGEKRV